MSVNIIMITPTASLSATNAVLEAMGRGPDNISRPASTDPNAAWDDTPTHYYASDQGVDDATAQAFLNCANGDLPPLGLGFEWGVNGCISAADALVAVNADNFSLACFNDGFTALEQVDAALAAYSPRLYKLPPMPE